MVNTSYPQNIAQSLNHFNLNKKNWIKHLKKFGLPIAVTSVFFAEALLVYLFFLPHYFQQQKLLEQSQ